MSRRCGGMEIRNGKDNGKDCSLSKGKRICVFPGQLVPGLKTEKNHAAVNLQMETNVAGLFACGDIAGTPYQYIKAAGQGNVAALSAVSYLNRKKETV